MKFSSRSVIRKVIRTLPRLDQEEPSTRRARRIARTVVITAATVSLSVVGALANGNAAVTQSERELPSITATQVDDDFTAALAGDILIARATPSNAPREKAVADLFREADVAMANLETPTLDIRSGKIVPANNGLILSKGAADAAPFLKDYGFDLLGFANNHTMSWGADGARETMRRMEEAGIGVSGFGATRSLARAPAFANTAKGRVGLVSFTSSYFPGNVATDPLGVVPATPGVSALRTTRFEVVTREQFAVLKQIADQRIAGFHMTPPPTGNELSLFGVNYRAGDAPDTYYAMNPNDRADILRNVRQAKQQGDFLAVSMHTHEFSNCPNPIRSGDGSIWPCQKPTNFTIQIAHEAIDNGADVFFVQGPHVLDGIEIYKGRPIFYSLGNLFAQSEGITMPRDALPDDVGSGTTVPEYTEKLWSYLHQDSTVYESIVAVARYRDNRISEIRLHPIDLGYNRRQTRRGLPEIAAPAMAQRILQRLQRMSEPFGTRITIENDVGVIRIGKAR